MNGRTSWALQTASVLMLLSVALCAQGQGAASGGVGAIESALRLRQYELAIQLAQAELTRTPRDARILTLEGIAYSDVGANRKALASFLRALAVDPDSLAALEGAAQLEFNAGDSGAEALLQRIVRIRPEEPTSHAMMGAIAYRRNDCPTAVEHFSKALATIAQEPTALTEYGACLLDQERPEDAVVVLQQAHAVKPEDAGLRYNLGVAQVAAHQDKEAIDTLQPLIQAAHPDPEALDEAAAAYEDSSNTPEAVRLLRMALIAGPKRLSFYTDFAALALKHSSWEVGLDVINVGLRQLPDAAPLYVARGILHVQLSQFSEAQADFENANRLDPTQTSGAIGAGMAQMQQHNSEEALATVEAQLKTHPDDSFLLFIRASALLQSGPEPGSARFAQARDAALKSIAARPGFILPRDLLAGIYLESGDYASAEEQCLAALALNPSDEKAIYHLIQALRKPGKDVHNEIPELTKRLALMLAETRKNEGAANRYRLYEPRADGAAEAPQPK